MIGTTVPENDPAGAKVIIDNSPDFTFMLASMVQLVSVFALDLIGFE